MVTLQRFLQCVQENVERITHYENAGDGSGGGCDCIGLIIGALRLAGLKWPGTHGSNWAARNAMDGLINIHGAGELFLGAIVYKAKEPGESGYDLPLAYSGAPDVMDYYHVGVVTSVQPLIITHCTSVEGGVMRDASLGQWRWGGKMKYVDYDGLNSGETALFRAIVTADNGYPVKLRSVPGTGGKVIAKVPLGAEAEVIREINDDWSFIRWDGMEGYMMRAFLQKAEGSASSTRETLLAVQALARAMLDKLDAALQGGEAM